MYVPDAIGYLPCLKMPNFRGQKIARSCCRHSGCSLKAMTLGPFVMICRPIGTRVMRCQLWVRLLKNLARSNPSVDAQQMRRNVMLEAEHTLAMNSVKKNCRAPVLVKTAVDDIRSQ
jgi:hypothetical protein